jgi:hypothetical protein
MMEALIYYGPAVLFTIVMTLWLYASNHARRHLFVATCPLCRRDDYRKAIMAERMGIVPEGTAVAAVAEVQHD